MVFEGPKPGEKEAKLEADEAEKGFEPPKLTHIKEGEQELDPLREKPESVIDSPRVAHEAGSAENKLADIEDLSRNLGVENTRALEHAREQVYQGAKAKDQTAKLVDLTLSEHLIGAANQAIRQEKELRQQTVGGRKYADLLQPARVVFNERKHLDKAAQIKHEKLFVVADKLSQDNNTEMREAEAEGMTQFYEQMTGVPLQEMRDAYQEARDLLLKMQQESNAIVTPHETKMRYSEVHRELNQRLNELENIDDLPTKEKHITLPKLLRDDQSPHAKYHYDGAPQDMMSAQKWLSETRKIVEEAKKALGPQEEKKTEVEEASAEEAQPAEQKAEENPKKPWYRFLG
jgi:choline dehydrogenase-like flavoprotein